MKNKTFKKVLSLILSFAVLMALFAPTIKIAKAASATVTFNGCGSSFSEPCFWIPPNGSVIPASSQPSPLFSFNIKKSGGATTLASIKVNLVDGSAGGSVAAADIASLAVYKRTSWGTGYYGFPDVDKIGELTTINVFSANASANNIINITQADPKNTIGTDFFSAEYIVTIKTSASWSGADQLRYGLSADWITVSDGAIGTAYTYPAEFNDWYYATPPAGYVGQSLGVEMASYISSTEADLRFTMDVDEVSAETASNYTIVGPSTMASTAVLQPDLHTVRVTFSGGGITANTTMIRIKGPSGVKDKMGGTMAANMDVMIGGGGGPGGGIPLVISEVMIGQGSDGLKEFVEIYNMSPGPMNLKTMGVKLWSVYLAGSVLTNTKVVDLSLEALDQTIPANGFYLIGSSAFTATPASDPDKSYNASLIDAVEGALKPNSGIYISTSDAANMAIIDKAGWGTSTIAEGASKCSPGDPESCALANDGKSIERKANPSSTVASMTSGGADIAFGNSYKSGNNQYDFVQKAMAEAQNIFSTIETPGGAGFGAMNNPPEIYHSPLFQAPTTSDLIIMAEIVDDSGDIAASNTKLYYRTHDDDGALSGTAAGSWQSTSGTKSSGNSFVQFIVPSASLDAAKDLDYYLRAADSVNYACFPGNSCGGAGNTINPGVVPYFIDLSASAGSRTISGYVRDTIGNAISSATVFVEGSPFVTTTNASGTFTLSNIPDGIYTVKAKGGNYTVNGTAANYTDGWLDGISLNSNNTASSGNIITLIQGSSGMGGDKENPWVMWSAPGDMMQGFPIEALIMAVFGKAMASSTITGGASTNNNIYLINDIGAIVAGSVTYYAASLGRPAGVPADPYMMIYDPTANLEKGKSYTLVIKDLVTDSAGNRLMGNRPSGGHSVNFTTFFDTAGGTFGQGSSFPPYVAAVTPGGGAFNVPINTKINIDFSESMSSSSINTTNIKLYKVTNPFSATESLTAVTGYAVSLDTSGKTAIITLGGNLNSSSHYRIKVLGGAQSSKGMYMTSPENIANEMFMSDFETGTAIDGSAPIVQGVFPKNNDIGVSSNIASIDIGFSESMDPSTINSNTIKLKRGTTLVAGTIIYDVGEKAAHFMPTNALAPGATYILTVTSGSAGVKDLAGNILASDSTTQFTTSTAVDSEAPRLEFANCDDFSCAVTFSEPVNNAKMGESDYTSNYSVLVKTNYVIKAGTVGTTDWVSGTGVHSASLSSANLEYDQMNNTIIIKGVTSMAAGEDFKITISNIQDKSGNTISGSANTFVGPVKSSMETGGMMGPGGDGGMMGPATIGGGSTVGMGGSAGFDFGGQWEKPKNVMPMNMMAGLNTKYIVEFPISTAVPAGGTIKLTFPTGTDISSTALESEAYSMMNKDINGPATGTVKIYAAEAAQSGGTDDDGVTVNTTSRIVTATIKADGDGAASGDMLRFDIKGIKNPTVPKSFDTSGYTVDIKTFDASGKLLESMTSFPFFINPSGSYTLNGTLTAAGATTGAMLVMIGSPMTGPMDTQVNFATNANGTAAYSFANLPEGEYWLFTEPSLTLNATDYVGYMKPDPIFINAANCASSICTKNITLTSASSGSALTVYIIGNFTTMSANDRNIDIFAGGPDGNIVKTVTVNAANYTAGSPYSTTLYIPSLDGTTVDQDQWWVGMGPAMPKGAMMMGPPPMPSWMPPANIEVGLTGAATWKEQSSGTVAGNTANDGKIIFSITSASNQIIGYVIDGSGSAIANVEVEAHRTMGGFGMPSGSQTDSSGKFTLKVTTGAYEVNAWMPGMPWSPGKIVDVRGNTAADDGNTTADVYKESGTVLVVDKVAGYNPSNTTEKDLAIKLGKTSTTISGKLLDESGNPVGYAPVWAYSPTTGQNMPSGTDSSGNYTIYVPNGSWNVEGFIPGIGDISYANNPVSISGSSKSDINLRSTASSLKTISGTVSIGGAAVANANIWVDKTTYHNGTGTNSSGFYQLKVPASTGYTLHAWAPGYGELQPVTVDALANITQNFTVAASDLTNLTLNFTNYNALPSNSEAFLDMFNPTTRQGNHERIDDLSTTTSKTISVKKSSGYELHLMVPGIGDVSATCENVSGATCTDNASAPDTWNITGDAALTFVVPNTSSLYTFTVTVTDGTSPVSGAFVWMGSNAGYHNGSPVNELGVATLKAPNGTYKLGVDRPGYTSVAPIDLIAGGGSDNLAAACGSYTVEIKTCVKTIVVAANPYTLSGQIKNASGAAIPNAWVWADKVVSATNLTFTGGWTGSGADASGNYSLSISNGYWLIRAVADGYQETVYTVSGAGSPIQVNGASLTGKDITLVAQSGYTALKPKSAPITPASGGTVDDTNNTGVKLVIPPSTLGTDTSSSTINIKDTTSIPKTDSIAPLGGKGKEISATNSSGQSITSLSGSATLEIKYNELDLPAGVNESQLTLVYFDNASGSWVELAATQDSTNNSFTGATTHFTTYAIAYPADTAGPTTPGAPTESSHTSSSATFTWTASTDTETSVMGYEVLRSTNGVDFTTVGSTDPWSTGTFVSSALNTSRTYTNSSLSSSTTYYYQVVAYDTAGNHSSSSSSLQVTTSSSGGGGGSSAPQPTTPSTSNGQVTATPSLGGNTTLTNTDNTYAKVSLPVSAVSADTTINIAPLEKTASNVTPPASSMGLSIVGKIYNIAALAGSTAITNFSKLLALEFKYKESDLPAGAKETDLAVYYFNANTNIWTLVSGSIVDSQNNKVAVNVNHLTQFALMVKTSTVSSPEQTQPQTNQQQTGQQSYSDPLMYSYEYISQSDYPRVIPGGSAALTLTLKNTGTATWYNSGANVLRLGTSKQNDRASRFFNSNDWLSDNRTTNLDQTSVAPGEIGTFTFIIAAPSQKDSYKEYFQPVIEGITWMKDIGIYWNIIVEDGSYRVQYLNQSPYLTLDKSETAALWVEYKNTGTNIWQKGGNNPVHLGTSNPLDRDSLFSHSSWLSTNRSSLLDKNTIAPNETARFGFTVQAPNTNGSYREYFRPVVEGLEWMEDVGLYWDIIVK